MKAEIILSGVAMATALQCPSPQTVSASATPTYRFSSFTYPTTTTRYATSNTATPTTQYAKHYTQVSSLFTNVLTTSWPNWTPGLAAPTDLGNPYGNFSYSQLWNDATPMSVSRGIYSTTVSPTPVPSSELIFPPPLAIPPADCYPVPRDFVFGIAGSASQCEGAVFDQGKAPAITDLLGNLLSLVGTEGINDYTTNEHFYLYKQDINRFAAIGAKYYYLTIQWTRIMPFAVPGSPVSSDNLQHYSDVIDYVLSKGMKPMIALTHFDTPLQFFGGGKGYVVEIATTKEYYGVGLPINFGYQNETFEDAYVNYAQIVMAHYADRVPLWITFNEPQVGSPNGAAVNNVIKAHARVVHYYREVLNGTGKVSMKMGVTPAVPLDASSSSDKEAAQTFTDVYVNPYLNPLAVGKDYPLAFKQAIQDFVPLSASDLNYLNGTLDFISLDAYNAPIISYATDDYASCAMNNASSNPYYRFPICLNQSNVGSTGWLEGYAPQGQAGVKTAPYDLRTQLNYVWDTFKLPIVISEFGAELPTPVDGYDLPANLFNSPQSSYLLSYLREMLEAIWLDGVHVMGAFAWNWGDDWEFESFDTGFGLQYVNHTTQERAYRRSFFDVVDYIESRRQT